MSGFLTDLATGFAVLLDDADIGLTWKPDGSAYTDSETGLHVMAVPDTPDRIVTLTAYALGDDAVHGDSTHGLQVRSRADGRPTEVTDLDDTITDALTGHWPMTLATGIRVVTLTHTSGVSLGRDDSNRWSWSSNYTLELHRPGPYRL